MLFKALLSRINGGTDTSSRRASSSHRRFSRRIYEKYPNLADLVLKLFRIAELPLTEMGQSNAEINSASLSNEANSVFPALEVIERSGLPFQHRAAIRNMMQCYMECPVWSLREKSAKTLSLIIDEKDVVKEAEKLLLPTWYSQNALHGRLVCLRYLVNRHQTPLFGNTLGNLDP